MKSLIDGSITKIRSACFGVVDVRDVALAHVNAQNAEDLGQPNIFGQHRFILSSSEGVEFYKIGVLAKEFDDLSAYPIPTLPDSDNSPHPISYSNEKARKVLGIQFRPLSETIHDGLRSLIEFGVVSKK